MATLYIKETSPTDDFSPVRISASRGRDIFGDGTNRQVIELGSSRATNTITSVTKDNILWIERFP